MTRTLTILALLVAIVALPFLLRKHDAAATAWHEGDPTLVIVTPHNEAIRYEFARGFSAWHQAHYGKPVKIEWRAIGGTTEIMRYLTSEYASAAKAWWTRDLKKPWPDNATETVTASSPPKSEGLLDLYNRFRATDNPAAFSARIDLFFGGGEFDHSNAYRQGLTVPPWDPKNPPKNLFTQDSGLRTQDSFVLIPEKSSGEIWRTPTLFGNVISTFGICYNLDRLRQLHVASPPTSWADLADPVYFAQVGAADPSKSGSVAKTFEMMIHQRMHDTVRAAGFSDDQIATFEIDINAYAAQRDQAVATYDELKRQSTTRPTTLPASRPAPYHRGEIPPSVPATYEEAVERGWLNGIHLVQRIGANARYFTDSASKVPIDVSEGDAAVGMSIDFYGRYQAQSTRDPNGHERMVYITPVGGSSVSCDPISLLRGAEHRDLAVRFIQYVLSEDGQKLWCYRPGEPGGPEKFPLRRLPIRRDFYPSTNPIIQKRHEEHLKHSSDNLADPAIDPYTLAENFVYYPRWTASHFNVQRDIIRIMCVDAGDELKDAWHTILTHGGPQKQTTALEIFQRLPTVKLHNRATQEIEEVPLTWRTAPDIPKKYDKLEYTREWTRFFRATDQSAKDAVK